MRAPRLLLCVVILLGAALAQDPATGFPPYGSFQDGAFDAVNRQNLNMNIRIPIASVPGRGVDFSYALVYDSLVWKKQSNYWLINTSGGWKTDSGIGTITWSTSSGTCLVHIGFTSTWVHYYNYTFKDPSGTTHSFNVSLYETDDCSVPASTAPTGYATDNSGWYLDATEPTAPVVYNPAGIQVSAGGTLTDTNGNQISKVVVSSSETDWKDTRGQIVLKVISAISSGYKDFLVLQQDGTYQTTRLNYAYTAVKSNFACSGVTELTGNSYLPTSLSLPNGQSYTFTYEDTPGFTGYKTGRLKRVTLPTGGYYEYTYPTTGNMGMNCTDASHVNLTRVINDGTTSATWTYARALSGTNWVTTVTAPQLPYDTAANQSVFTFDSTGKLTSQKFYQGSTSGSLKRTINTTWAANGTPANSTTILENNQQSKVDTTFDSYANLTQLIEYGFGSGAPGAAVRTTTLTYSTTLGLIKNRVTQQMVRAGGATGVIKSRADITYDGTTVTCITGAPQNTGSCLASGRGNPTRITTYTVPATPSGAIIKNFAYDSLGNLLTADLNCCQQKQWNYSVTTQYTYPDSVVSGSATGPQLTTSATYNAYTGRVESSTDENGEVTSFAYDSLQRLIDVGRPDNAHITTSYDDAGRTITVSVPIQGSDLLRRATYFDGLARPFKQVVTDAGGTSSSISETQYDPLGHAYKVSTPHNATAQYWTETRFDALSRPTVVIPPDGTASSNNTSYSYSGNTLTVTDPAGKQRKYQNDALGRLEIAFEPDVANSNALTQQTSYAYTVLDDVATVTQGVQTRTYNYDGLGRLSSATTPEAGTVSYVYNQFDQVTQRTDARGVITAYTYDTLNRLAQVSYNVGATGVPATSSVTYTYGASSASNNNGRLVTVNDGGNTETYTYDLLGRVTNAAKVIGGTSYTVGYAYNLAGEVSAITYPSGRVVQQSYNAIGRLTTIFSGATNYASGFGYNPAGQVTGFNYGNGVTAAFGYSPERLLLQTVSYAKATQTLFSLSYGYAHPNGAKNGQITNVTDNLDAGRTVNYTYDALHRLSTAVTTGSVSYPQWGLSWSYDRYGNRTNQTVTAGSAPSNSLTVSATTNRITSTGFIYDANGNLTQEGSASLQYKYDAENRMVSFNSGTATYSYAGALRVKKVAGSTTTVYVFSGSKVIAEYLNSALSKEYVYSGGTLLATIAGSAVTYHQPDHLSTRLETDLSGVVTRTFGQYPFGEVWYETGTASKWKFTSYERDGESGLDYATFRYDSSRLGRFMSPDPLAGSLSNPQSLNRYTYVGNDPINGVDPLGLARNRLRGHVDAEDDFGGAAGVRAYLGLLASRPGQFGSTWSEFDLLEIPVTVSTYTPAQPVYTPISGARNYNGYSVGTRIYIPGAWSTIIIGTGFDLFGGGGVNPGRSGGDTGQNELDPSPTSQAAMLAIHDAFAKFPNVCDVGGFGIAGGKHAGVIGEVGSDGARAGFIGEASKAAVTVTTEGGGNVDASALIFIPIPFTGGGFFIEPGASFTIKSIGLYKDVTPKTTVGAYATVRNFYECGK